MSPEGKKYSYVRPTKEGKTSYQARLDKWITSVDVRHRGKGSSERVRERDDK